LIRRGHKLQEQKNFLYAIKCYQFAIDCARQLPPAFDYILDDTKSEVSLGSDYQNSQNSTQDLEGYETDLKKKLIPVDYI